MAYTKWFNALSKNDAAIAGGKGASLGEMTQAGIPVPPGFVIVSDAFEYFLEDNELASEIDSILHHVDHKNIETVERASEEIKALILAAKMPKKIEEGIKKGFSKLNARFVAVRSSATAEDSASAAWAGQLESYLNTTQKELLDNVKRCWSSLFTPRAIFYRIEKGLAKTKVSVAVVIQKMVESEISGIAFSVHPVTQDRNQILIEAGLGLGEAIVSGQITPDNYVVHKKDLTIIEKNANEQRKKLVRAKNGGNEWVEMLNDQIKLTDSQVLELSKLIIRIENHYSFPCDIEWAYEKGKFYIVQSRPITTLSEPDADNGTVRIINQASSSGDGKILENMKVFNKECWTEQGRWIQPTMVFTIFSHWHKTKIIQQIIPEIKFHTTFSIDGHSFVYSDDFKNIHQYLKDKSKRKGEWSKLAKSLDLHGKNTMNQVRLELKNSDEYIIANIERVMNAYTEFAGFWCADVYLSELIIKIAKEQEYIQYDEELFARVHPHLRTTWIEQEVKDSLKLAKMVLEKNHNKKPESVMKVIEKRKKLQQELQKYIKSYEWKEISKWSGEPLSQQKACERITEEIENTLNKNNIKTRKGTLPENKLDDITLLSIATSFWRAESGKMEMEMALRMRSILEKVAKKNKVKYEDILYLSPAEFVSVVKDKGMVIKNIEEITRRKREYFSTVAPDGKEIILTKEDKAYDKIKDVFISKIITETMTDKLQGVGASKGKVTGKARIILSAKEFGDFEAGDVLVAPETTPSFVPLMRKAAAIVTGKGGITSHAAIVSRELKKPCIIAVKDVTRILKNGDLVEVDADNGIVKILKSNLEIAVELPIKYPEWEFEFQQREQHNILMADFWCRAALSFNRLLKLGNAPADYIYTHLNIGYTKKEHRKQILAFIRNANLKTITWIISETERTTAKMTKTAKAIHAANAEKRSNQELASLWKRFDSTFLDAVPWFFFPYYIVEQNVLADRLKKALLSCSKKIGKYTDINNALQILIFPKKQTSFQQERKEFYKLVQIHMDAAPEKILKRERENYLDKYSWTKTFLLLPKAPLSEEELLARIKESSNKRFIEEYLMQEKIKQANLALEKKLMQIIAKDKGTTRLVALNKELGWLLTWSVEEMLKACNDSAILFREICRRLEIKYEDWGYFTSDELIAILNGTRKVASIGIPERRKGYIYMMQEGQVTAVYGERAANLADELEKQLHQVNTDISQLTGQCAYPGKVKGSVRKALVAKESNMLLKGETLVCPATSPDYVPAMKRASAIITDEGGLLSHAAIMSREFHVPCVIGTKIASKVLKDGDLVEVDADNGVVKILENASRAKIDKATFKEDSGDEYVELFAHDFPLSQIEINNDAETLTDIRWSKEKFTIKPHSIHVRKDGRVHYLYSAKGMDWKIEQAGKFPKEIAIRETMKAYNAIKEPLEQEMVLTREELADFVKKLRNLWIWFDCFWWMIMHYERNNLELGELLKLRKDTEGIGSGSAVTLRMTFKNLFPGKEKYIDVITNEEAIYNKLPSEEVLKKRLKGYVLTNRRLYNNLDELRKDYHLRLAKNQKINSEILKGQTAFKGHVTGKAVLIRTLEDMTRFKKGNILVASATNPAMIPAIKKAGAIISEHGGVISHAAITSRELKIPCVVGVKNALQLINDGDMVEVDADNGVVRKIDDNNKLDVERQQKDLVEKFLELTKGDILNSPMYNYRAFSFNAGGLSPDLREYYHDKTSMAAIICMKENASICVLSESKLRSVAVDMLQRYWKEPKLLSEAENEFESIKKEIEELYAEFLALTAKKKADIGKIFPISKKIVEKSRLINARGWMGNQIDKDICKELLLKNKSKIKEERFDEIWPKMAAPPIESFDAHRKRKILQGLVQKKTIEKVAHEMQYGFANYSKITDVNETIRIIKTEFLIDRKGELKKVLTKIETETDRKRKDYLSWHTTLNKEEKKLADYLNAITYMRDRRKDCIGMALVVEKHVATELMKRIGLEAKYADYLMHEEIIKGEGYLRQKKEEIRKRTSGFCILIDEKCKNHGQQMDYDKAKERLEKRYQEQSKHEKTDTIKGQTGNRGTAKGTARIVTNPEKQGKFNKGDILIAGMTRPEYVPLMKLAGAIVTDEGGITCHAAIVSRELGIPCIIGTKNATRVLKDGDLVEVDADNGVVRILKHAKK